jgi:hypothetical protein
MRTNIVAMNRIWSPFLMQELTSISVVIVLRVVNRGARAHPKSPEMEAIRARRIWRILDVASPLPLAFLAGDLNAGPPTSTHIYKELGIRGFVDAFAARVRIMMRS